MVAPANMFLPDSRPAVPLPRFSRHLHASEGDGGESGEVCIRPGLYTQASRHVSIQYAMFLMCPALSFDLITDSKHTW